MFRFLLYGFIIYVIYDFFLKPFLRFFSAGSHKDKINTKRPGQIIVDRKAPDRKADFTEGEYIEYEDIE